MTNILKVRYALRRAVIAPISLYVGQVLITVNQVSMPLSFPDYEIIMVVVKSE